MYLRIQQSMTHLCTLPLKIEEKLSVALATYTRCRTTLDSPSLAHLLVKKSEKQGLL